MQLPGNLLTVYDETSPDLQGGQIADEVVTTVEFLSIRVRQTFDSFLALLLSFLSLRLVGNDLVLLSVHPLDVHDFLALMFVVVATLPVGLPLLILLLVEQIELLVSRLDLLLYLVSLSQSFVLLGIRLLHLLPDALNLTIQLLLLTLVDLYFVPNLVLLSLKLFDLGFDLGEAFGLRNRLF